MSRPGEETEREDSGRAGGRLAWLPALLGVIVAIGFIGLLFGLTYLKIYGL